MNLTITNSTTSNLDNQSNFTYEEDTKYFEKQV